MGRFMEQKRASFAYCQLQMLQGPEGKKEAEKIKSEACKTIALILTSGFLQAMDFAKIKLHAAYNPLKEWLATEISQDGPGLSSDIRTAAANGHLNEGLANVDAHEYRRAMQESLAFLGWLKSKAEGKKMEIAANTENNH